MPCPSPNIRSLPSYFSRKTYCVLGQPVMGELLSAPMLGIGNAIIQLLHGLPRNSKFGRLSWLQLHLRRTTSVRETWERHRCGVGAGSCSRYQTRSGLQADLLTFTRLPAKCEQIKAVVVSKCGEGGLSGFGDSFLYSHDLKRAEVKAKRARIARERAKA